MERSAKHQHLARILPVRTLEAVFVVGILGLTGVHMIALVPSRPMLSLDNTSEVTVAVNFPHTPRSQEHPVSLSGATGNTLNVTDNTPRREGHPVSLSGATGNTFNATDNTPRSEGHPVSLSGATGNTFNATDNTPRSEGHPVSLSGATGNMTSVTHNTKSFTVLPETLKKYGNGSITRGVRHDGNFHDFSYEDGGISATSDGSDLFTTTVKQNNARPRSIQDDLTMSEQAAAYRVSKQDCMGNTFTIYASAGTVRGLDDLNPANNTQTLKSCRWRIVAPAGRYVVLTAEMLGFLGPCSSGIALMFRNHADISKRYISSLHCGGHVRYSPVLFMKSNVAVIEMVNGEWDSILDTIKDYGLPKAMPRFKIVFTSTTKMLWTEMTLVFTSPMTGFVTSPGYDPNRPNSPYMNATCTLSIPDGHAVMVSFPYVQLKVWSTFLKLTSLYRNGSVREANKYDEKNYIPTTVYHFTAALVIKLLTPQWYLLLGSGMNMSFSFHADSAAPVTLPSGLFVCDDDRYAGFKQHVHCNLRTECESGEDEGSHCPYSSPACNGSVDADGKCFVSVQSQAQLSWAEARQNCQAKGGDLAMMKTLIQYQALWKVFEFGRDWSCAYVGLELTYDVLFPLYKRLWSWVDGTTAFSVNITPESFEIEYSDHRFGVMVNDRKLVAVSVTSSLCSRIICQIDADKIVHKIKSVDPPLFNRFVNNNNSSTVSIEDVDLVPCSAGHVTHDFLRCYSGSQCGALDSQQQCRLALNLTTEKDLAQLSLTSHEVVHMFWCNNRRQTIPYTLVCDFRQDCLDDSDETFCKHPVCTGMFQCENGQCIPLSKRCDHYIDCWDESESDENMCKYKIDLNAYDFVFRNKLTAPTVIDFLKDGFYKQTPIHSSAPCPTTHFRCWGSHGESHCLPVYLRCNNKADCPNGEDELQCENYTCPGFYRCRDSRVCLHVQQVCDGVAQCPRQDDELLCDVTCPAECGCQGLAFVCRRPFPADSYPSLRYLDASHSGMTLGDLHSNTYLIYVSLATCDIRSVDQMRLSNLQHLDLSHNVLSSVDMSNFLHLENLQTLSLTGNPLTLLASGTSDKKQFRLSDIDLSFCKLSLLSIASLKNFLTLQAVNVSFSTVDTITEEGFRFIPSLSNLDLRGNPISNYPLDLLKGLNNLRLIYVDDYKLCCPDMLPEGFEQSFCFAPQNEISSCNDLLRYEIYRVFLWLICSASILGNIGCFFFRNWLHKSQSASGFNVFVSNLCVADCLMGVYLAFVGGADHVYRGSYYRYEKDWLSSIPCSVAGFVSMLSNEVSALTICLITLDRFVVLRFPFSRLKFDRQSAAVGCALTWVVGVVLAAVPLLVPHWTFYGQTGICVPLPVTRQQFEGRGYSFGVLIVFNFLLFLLIAGGQVSIYLSVQANRMSVDSNRKLQDMTIARRLITVAVSDFLCWFPIGLLGLLASGDVPIPGEVNVALAIFILPLNSALNPFLYTFNMMMEKRKKNQEQKMLAWLEASGDRLSSTSTVAETASASSVPRHSVSTSSVPRHSLSTSSVPSLARSSEHTQYRGQQTDEFATKNDVLQSLYTALQCKLVSSHQVRTFLASLQDDGEG